MKRIACALALMLAACSGGGAGGGAFDGGIGGSGAIGSGGKGGIGGGSGAGGGGGGTGGAPSCPLGETLCGAACTKLLEDPLHCGSCEKTCNPGDVCAGGSCQVIADCTATPCVGLSYCDLATKKCLPGCLSSDQCGQNEACNPATHTCDCAPGQHRCGGVCIAEDSISACGAACSVCAQDPNGQAACSAGQCSLTCNSGFHDCGGSCKSNSDPASCGSSCTPCAGDPNGSVTCNQGQCGISCNSGFHSCSGQCASDTSPTTCGTSCTPCPTKSGATASCVSGACVYQCANGVTLGSAVTYPTVTDPKDIALGDVTGDGKIDVVVAGSSVAVHAGNGDGTFKAYASYTLANGTAVAIGDITGDGKNDVIAGAGVSNTTLPPRGLWKLTQTSTGTLSSAVQVSSTIMPPSMVFLKDFTGDGKLDYAISMSSSLAYASGLGSGSFGTQQTKSLGSTAAFAAEVTGDSRPDLVLAVYDKVTVVPGSSSGFGTETSTTVTYDSYYGISSADMNGDGKGDVLLGSTSSAAAGMFVLTSNGGGLLQAPTTQSGGKGSPIVGDFNHDGKPDVAQLYSSYVYLRLSNASGALAAPIEIYTGALGVRGAAADLDGDGFSDLVLISNSTWNDEIYVLRSTCK